MSTHVRFVPSELRSLGKESWSILVQKVVTFGDLFESVSVETTWDMEPLFFLGLPQEYIEPITSITLMTKLGYGIKVTGKSEFVEAKQRGDKPYVMEHGGE
jgi:hypothetical protein